MKKENTAIRLKKIMSDRGLRQVDILNLTAPFCKKYNVKMNKSDISQYCSGKTEPNQDKLFVLGMALNVSEAWLMGYDVPMNRRNYNTLSYDMFGDDIEIELVSRDKCSESDLFKERILTYAKALLNNFKVLDEDKQKNLLDYSCFLVEQMNKDIASNVVPIAAHERTDMEVTDEMRKHDDDIMDDDNF